MSYRIVASDKVRRRLAKLPRHIAQDIVEKICWLAENAEEIKHERLSGRKEYSLHSGQYRIPYLLDRENELVTIVDVGKHDKVYRRLQR